MRRVKSLNIVIILLSVTLSMYSCGGDNNDGGSGGQIETAGVTGAGTWHETWESSQVGKYEPSAGTTQIGGDEGTWVLSATVDGGESCGPTPHEAEILLEDDNKKFKLVSNNSGSGCSDNVYFYWETNLSGSSKQALITPNTRISFSESGELYGSTTTTGWGSDNCGLGIPCGIYLAVIDNRGNGLFYRLQWPDDAEESYGSTYAKILLDRNAGTYSRNLYEDFSKISNFNSSEAYVKAFQIEINPWDDSDNMLGWAIIDDIKIYEP